MVVPEWLRVATRQELYLFKYITQRKLFERRMAAKGYTLLNILENWAKVQPNQTCIIQNDHIISYQGMVDEMNKRAKTFYQDYDLRYGSKVALFMNNRPEFVSNWFGAINVGAVPAFINNNLRMKQLMHCLTISDSEIVIVDGAPENLEAIYAVREDILKSGKRIVVDDNDCQLPSNDFDRLPPKVNAQTTTPISHDLGRGQIKMDDPFCLIFTSGTTGLPKAAPFTHQAALKTCTFKMMLGMKPGEVGYTALPLYHTFASQVAVTGCIIAGASTAIAPKFSASTFWQDCIKYDAKYIYYIGEMMRYLLEAPPSELDKKHNVTRAIGSGLRYDIWPRLAPRFGDMWIYEIYGATEGNIQFANIMNDESCIGRLTPIMKYTIGAHIVKFDPIEEKILRNENGFAIKADYDEAGLLIGEIKKDFPFNGYYNDKKKSDEKILKDVFVKGDRYFDSGDLLKMSADYKIRFSDRVGDTFRWKGENVSTVEVANTISEENGWLNETNCYGIKLPWAEGACGALAITLNSGATVLSDHERKLLYNTALNCMPAYQRPMFIRIQAKMEITGTFKNRKVELVKEGYDFKNFEEQEKIYLFSKSEETYVPLTERMVQDISAAKITF